MLFKILFPTKPPRKTNSLLIYGFFSFAILLIIVFFSCTKDGFDGLIQSSNRNPAIEQAKQNLKTQAEKDFFDFNFVTSTNPYILEELSTRNEGDSLVNLVYEYLLLENQEANFAINLIGQFGYPIWNHSTISPDTNNINYKVVITPFAKTDEDFISCYTMAFPIEGEIDNVEANEWLVYLFTREVLDSLVLLDFVEDPNTVFRVAQFVNYDSLLFGTGSEEYITWLQTVGIDFMVEEDGNLIGELDDRNGGMVFCTYIRIPCDENLAGELDDREKGCGFNVYVDVSNYSNVGDGTIGGVGYTGPSGGGGGGNSNTTNSED